MSVEIRETCSCGAEFFVKGDYDFAVACRYEQFLKAHEVCRKIRAIEQVTEKTKGNENEISSG